MVRIYQRSNEEVKKKKGESSMLWIQIFAHFYIMVCKQLYLVAIPVRHFFHK